MADQAAFNMYESASLPTDDLPLNPKGKWEYIGWIPIVWSSITRGTTEASVSAIIKESRPNSAAVGKEAVV